MATGHWRGSETKMGCDQSCKIGLKASQRRGSIGFLPHQFPNAVMNPLDRARAVFGDYGL